jgi:EAL domain-containing protein (putative c-di-GMP-specific phosphodiesterase class I)
MTSGEVVGTEALLRWRNKALGEVAPADFIPLAEETGLIVPIGEWVMRAACAQCKAWERGGLAPLSVSVNIGTLQFRRSNLPQLVQTVLAEHPLDARWLGIEINERSIMRDAENTAQRLAKLRELGVAIAIDDFGTGCSSLTYLKRFPVTAIKMDRSFVRDISADPNDAAIVSAIIATCMQLGVKAVAAGVETAAQLALLSQTNCDQCQGYAICKPASSADMQALVHLRRIDDAAGA